MSNVGATTGKEPDYIADEDLRTADELRGDMKAISKAKMSLAEKATVQGAMKRMAVLESLVSDMTEQHNRVIGLISTMRLEFDQFKQQRAIELNMKVNHGSTTPGD